MAMAVVSTAHAIDWRFEPSVGASATYTDNVNQSHSNPQDALILTETPGFTLHSVGSRRLQASLQYGLTGVERFGGDQSNDVFHNLNAVGKAELVKDFLFVDGTASISQELISLLGSPADATTNSANRTTVGTYSISPYIQQRLGTFAFAQARYTTSGAIFQNNVAPNINANSFAASLNSGTQFTDLSWGLNYSIRKAQYGNSANSTFESASATAGYALTRQFRVFGTVGQDWNDYLSVTGISGSSHSVGFGWSPTRRANIVASVGERYFGRTYSFSGNYRTRMSQWTLQYSEDVSDVSQLVTDFNNLKQVNFNCPAGTTLPPNPTFSDVISAGCKISSVLFGSSVTQGVFISRLLTGGTTWSKGKSSLGLNVFDLRRQYQQLVGLPEDETRGIIATYSYRLQPHTSLIASLGYTNNLVPAGLGTPVARNDDLYTTSVGVSHQFDPKLSGSLTLYRQQRNSNDPASNFDENRITASALMRF